MQGKDHLVPRWPWRIREDRGPGCVIEDADGTPILFAYDGSADLAAAAPELVEALEGMLAEGGTEGERKDKARRALDKAKGIKYRTIR